MAESSLKRVENTVGKGEIARYEQFLLFPQYFYKRLVQQTRKNHGLFGKGLNNTEKEGFPKHCGKRRKC